MTDYYEKKLAGEPAPGLSGVDSAAANLLS
jgi:hypothetical protein